MEFPVDETAVDGVVVMMRELRSGIVSFHGFFCVVLSRWRAIFGVTTNGKVEGGWEQAVGGLLDRG